MKQAARPDETGAAARLIAIKREAATIIHAVHCLETHLPLVTDLDLTDEKLDAELAGILADLKERSAALTGLCSGIPRHVR